MRRFINNKCNRVAILTLLSALTISSSQLYAAGLSYDEKIVFFSKQDETVKLFPNSLAISPNGHDVAFVAKNSQGMFVYFNDKPDNNIWVKIGKGTPMFNSTGDRVMYTAYDGKKWYVVIDNQKGPAVDKIADFLFSPDGKHYAYKGSMGKSEAMVTNNKIGQKYDHIEYLNFSFDSKRFCYSVFQNDKWLAVETKLKPQKEYAFIGLFAYSPNSNRVAYLAKKGKDFMVVLDGKESPISGETIGMMTFSPDSSRFAYGLFSEGKWHLVIDGEKGPAASMAIQFTFSPDSKKYAYSARFDNRERLIVDGRTMCEFDKIDTIAFSSDSAHIACRASEKDKYFVVYDGKPQKQYEAVVGPEFFPGKNSIYYIAKLENGKRVLITSDKMSSPYDAIGMPIFSSSGGRLAYTIEEGTNKYVIVDETKNGPYTGVRHMGFSPDEKHFAFSAQKEGAWSIVIDGTELKQKFYVLPIGQQVYFSSNTNFHLPIMTLKGEDPWLHRYEVEIKAQ